MTDKIVLFGILIIAAGLLIYSGILFGHGVNDESIMLTEGIIPQTYKTDYADGAAIGASFKICNEDTEPIDFIVEMQARPQGLLPMSFISVEKTCNPENPYAIHYEISLDAGKCMGATVGTDNFVVDVPEGKWDIYLLTVNKCWINEPQGNVGYPPYFRGTLVGTITV